MAGGQALEHGTEYAGYRGQPEASSPGGSVADSAATQWARNTQQRAPVGAPRPATLAKSRRALALTTWKQREQGLGFISPQDVPLPEPNDFVVIVRKKPVQHVFV